MANTRSKSLITFLSACALGAALLGASPAMAADAPKPTNSKAVAKILKDVQEDLKNKKYADAVTKLKEADGTAGKNAYDQHIINDLMGFSAAHTNDYPLAAKSWEAEVEDGLLTPQEQQQKIRALGELYYTLKTYDKAIDYGQRALKGGFGDDHTKIIVGQAYYLKGDWKGTLKFEDEIVSSTIKAGGTPTLEALQLILSSCVKLEDVGCQTKQLERLVTYYPKPEYWYNLLFGLIKETASSDSNTLQVFRLMLDTDVLKSVEDYIEYAQLGMDAGSPGEAQRVLQRGFDKTVFTDQRNKDKAQRLLDKAKAKGATDQPTLDKSAAEADTAATGTKNNAMGIAYFGYGQYDKAVDQFGKALSKGGLKNAVESQLNLGIAQLRAGHKEEAIKSLKAVKGDPILERLSALWVLHAKQVQ